MADQLFMFLAHGVAEHSTGYRTGARHALMIFVRAPSMDLGRLRAIEFTSSLGWCAVDLRRERSVGADASRITDDALNAAAEAAMRGVGGLVVYEDEMTVH